MRFLVDAQLPPALARSLDAHGHSAEHVADVGLLSADDRDIWVYASGVGAAIVTKDEDMPCAAFTPRRSQTLPRWSGCAAGT